jgi:succinoglycan biosynthesis protein ExoA
MLLKHRLRPRLRQMLPLATGPAMALGALSLALAPFDARALWLGAPAALWAAACVGYGFTLALRARSPAVAWSGPAAMVMHLAWSLGFLWRVARGR